MSPRHDAKAGVVIWGLSGYGKTQLALHYIEKHWPSDLPVLWIDASSVENIERAFSGIATELQNLDSRYKASTSDVMRWLCHASNKSWLMVFDSIEDSDGFDIRTYLPQCEHGRFIMTTVLSNIHSPLDFHGIGLEGIDDLAGSQILLGYLQRVLPDQFKDQSSMYRCLFLDEF